MAGYATELVLLIYVGVFVGVLLAFEGIRQLLSRRETGDEARNRRMRLVKQGATTEEVLQQLFHAESRGRRFGMPDVRKSLRTAGISASPLVFYLAALVLGATVFLAARRYMPDLQAAGFSVAFALMLPFAVLNALKRKRMEKLVSQLPDALDLMARGLRVGHPLNVTVQSVATDMSDPIGTEFGLIQDQVAYGTEIVDAFADFAERTDVEDTRYLAVSVGIQHGTGGNLGRVLGVLSQVIRDRATMKRKIHAISSEGRLSAFILSLLPFGIFGSIMTSSPSYYTEVMDDPMFRPAAMIIVGLVVGQALILRHLVSFKY
jgi:tight adherence protein B